LGGVFGETFSKEEKSPTHTKSNTEAKGSDIFSSGTGGLWTDTESDDESEGEGGGGDKLSDKQRLAKTLNNWCVDDGNTSYMLNEGGLESIIELSHDNDRLVKKQCSEAFMRLCSREPIRKRLFETPGLLHAVISLAYILKSPKRGLDCAKALLCLTLVPDSEETLVEHGTVSAFMALMGLGAETVAPVCVQGLFNLTCNRNYFNDVEKVIKSIANLPFTEKIDPRPLIVKSFLNTSLVFRLRPRLIEEGAIQVMDAYIPRILHPELKTVCATTLYNLSQSYGSLRSEMVTKGAVRVAVKLVTNENSTDECLFLATKALGNMCQDLSSRHRALEDGAMTVLQRVVARKGLKPRTYAACAETLAKISLFQDLIARLVKLGGIELLINLVSGDNHDAKHFCGTAFCNFLHDEKCHPLMISKGALKPLMYLSMDKQMKDDLDLITALSFAIYNISRGSKSTIEPLMEAGVLTSLVSFAKQESVAIRERVAAAICNLALSDYSKDGKSISEIMIKESGILECITDMMDDKEEMEQMPEVTQQCVTALAIFSHDLSTHEDITNHGCIETLIFLGLGSNDLETKTVCASVLSSLTFGYISRKRLIEKGGLKAIIRLSNSSDDKDKNTRLLCAMAFCNISMDPDGMDKMMEPDVDMVEVLASLSNCYSEEVQHDCARCFCNMSSYRQNSKRLCKSKAIHAVMMVAMVRAVKSATKELCAMSILNLITDETKIEILSQGVLQMFGTFCIHDNESMMAICSKVFCLSSTTKEGRKFIVKKKSSLLGLFSLIRSKCRETQLNCARAVLNMLSSDDTVNVATKYGGLVVLRVLTTLEDYSNDVTKLAATGVDVHVVEKLHISLREAKQSCETTLTKVLAKMVNDPFCMEEMIKENMASVLILLAQSTCAETVKGAVRAFCSCAYHKKMRAPMINAGCVSSIVWLVLSGQHLREIAEDASRAFCYLSISHEGRKSMVEQHTVTAMLVLVKRVPDESPVKALVALVSEG